MYITVLCKVVDNFGDIGTAWRLCRRLAKIQSQYKICLVVDDMNAFNIIAHGTNVIENEASPVIANEASPVIASEVRQSTTIEGIEIFQWQDNDFCHKIFSENDGERLGIILELFQCGRPDWMEKILFEESFPWSRSLDIRRSILKKGLLPRGEEYVREKYLATVKSTDTMPNESRKEKRDTAQDSRRKKPCAYF